jgi:cytochrome oxidase Cu insertion factor (SCO1/SenC/PrrC family)
MDIKELEILGDSANSHWYYRSKAKAVLTLLTQTRQGVNRARRGGDSRGGEAQAEGENPPNYMIDHSSYLYLMDAQGKYLAHFPHTIAPEKLADGVRAALQP